MNDCIVCLHKNGLINSQVWLELSPHHWNILYWQIQGKVGHSLWLRAHWWSHQTLMSSFNVVVTQMFLVKLNESQNKMKNHESVRGTDKNKTDGY